MINRQRTIFCSALMVLALGTAACRHQQASLPLEAGADASGATAPTAATVAANEAVAAALPLADQNDFADAQHGLVAAAKDFVVPGGNDGKPVWNLPAYDFIKGDAPGSVNPSLWRQAKLNGMAGLYKVTDGVYQLRGFDLANITLIEGATGWIIIDPLTSAETAAAALKFAQTSLGVKPMSALIFTHSHVDHFGGVEGALAATHTGAEKLRVIAPKGFMEEATSENILAGVAMQRRAQYMYGMRLPRSPRGHVDTGLGKEPAGNGSVSILGPTDLVDHTGQELTIDGQRFVFQYVPGSEAPAEMTFYLPAKKAFCGAELVSHTLHNLYTLRGAKVRNAILWSDYIEESRKLFADAEYFSGSHHWPIFGHANIDTFLARQADTYRFIHDQTLRLANEGLNGAEIAEQLRLPASLANAFYDRDYYGTVSHNAKAVYQYYFGWYDGNPANLNPLPPVESSKKYVELAGGEKNMLASAQKAYDRNEYRWCAELLNHLVFANPGNNEARALLAKVYDQLGYQAESGPWRDVYLSGAYELRHGGPESGLRLANAVGLLRRIPLASFLDSMAVRLDAKAAEDKNLTVNFVFSDLHETHVMHVENSVLHHHKGEADPNAVATLTLTHELFLKLAVGTAGAAETLMSDDLHVDGSRIGLVRFFAMFSKPDGRFNLVTP